jgi:glucose-6-phosphate 1-dehydrogenase
MMQNHLMQVFCLTAMEPPNSLDADAIRTEKVKVLQAAHLADLNNLENSAVRGQYSAGQIKTKLVPGYHAEKGVDPRSTTPTFVAMKLVVDNWRWQGVPFYLRTGKRLPKKTSEIAIQFRDVPHMLFQQVAKQVNPNVLTMRLQPNDGISMKFEVKMPGGDLRSRSVEMDFGYGTAFGKSSGGDAYDRLLLDCMMGDQTLFTRSDEVEAAWRVVTPIVAAWDAAADPDSIPKYAAGTWEPQEAEDLINRDGRKWRRL